MSDFLEFNGTVEAESSKAILFKSWFWDEASWVPKSQAIINRSDTTEEVNVKIKAWLCKKNGLVEEG